MMIMMYVTPHNIMRTNSLCVMGLPICEIFYFPPRTHTGTPRMRTGTMFFPDWRVRLSHAPFLIKDRACAHIKTSPPAAKTSPT